MFRSRAAIAACLIAFGGAAHAGSLDVNPVRIDLSAKQRVAALTVRNTGDQPTVIQLQPQAWAQHGNTDVLTPAEALIATPPIFTLAPGAAQIVRIGQRRPPDAGVEQAYRLIIQEVPPPPNPAFKGLRMALRISVPVFVAPATPPRGELAWDASLVNGKLALTATNTGNAHAHLAELRVSRPDATGAIPVAAGATYLLPRASHTWVLDAGAPIGTRMHVAGHDDSNAIQADLVVR
jgi:P pilus assembly protein, chaperone PapD